jgi:exo-beta-1,3-glucanase (GH17 family)
MTLRAFLSFFSLFFASAFSLQANAPKGVASLGFIPQAPSALLENTARAVAYSGFRSGQHPDRGDGAKNPSREEILEDLHLLIEHDLKLIRLYDAKENSQLVLEVIRSEELPIKVMLGMWLDAEKSNHETCAWLTEPFSEEELAENRAKNEAEVALGIELANGYPDIIVAVNVGNETLVDWNDHGVPIDDLVAYLKQVGEAIEQPVTTAENYAAYITYARQLEPVIDFAGVHVYPVWENKTIDEAIPYSIENMRDVQNALPKTPLAIAEAGWATVAVEFPEQANESNQIRYFTELLDWCTAMNITLFWFEAFDEDWKGHLDNPDGAEKHWGLWDVHRKPKAVVAEAL